MTQNDQNSTDNLIAQLADDAGECKRFCTIKHSLLWVLVTISYISAMVYGIGFRHDLAEFLDAPLKKMELAAAAITGIIAAIAAIWLGIPGKTQRSWLMVLPFLPLVILLALIGVDFWQSGSTTEPLALFPLKNIVKVSIIALIPTAVMILILRRAAPTQIYLTSLMASLAIGALVYSGFCLVCAYDHPVQLLINIILPIVVVCSIIMIAALKWVRW